MYRNLSNNKNLLRFCLAVGLMAHCYFSTLYSQVKYDYVWVTSANPEPLPGVEGNIISFHDGLVSVEYEQLTQKIYGNNASICDKEGNLLFYTNGCNILDASHEVMQDGEMINPGEIWDNFCTGSTDYPTAQDVLILPDRYSSDRYHLLHKKIVDVDLIIDVDVRQPELFITTIDMSLNAGLGGVVSKNVQVDSSYNYCAGYGEAISHSNQLDWWYLDAEEGSNLIIKYLLDETGMHEVSSQNIGTELTDDWCAINGQSAFSPDGKKYARFCSLTGLDVMDFDRETGDLSNHMHLAIPTDYNTSGLSFSPNSEYVYVSTLDSLWQVDIKENNLQDGLIFIDEYDGFQDPFATTIVKQQLGPDCRIYIGSRSGVSSMHVIRNPDAKGTDCDFRQHYLDLPYNNGILSMPNFPHFRVDEDDVCDPTITSLFDIPIEVVNGLDIYPNPTSRQLTIELPDIITGTLSLRDFTGQVVLNMEIKYSEEVKLDLDGYQAGMYVLEVLSESGERYVERVVLY